MVHDLAPFRQLQSHLNYFVNNQNEFLELLSLCFVALLAPRTIKFISKDFASDERKIEIEIVNYSVSHKKKQLCAIEMKGKLHNMVVNLRLRARNGDGKKFNIYSKLFATAIVRKLLPR